MRASIPGLGNRYVAGIYWPPNIPVTDFTQIISGAIEYANRFRTVFASELNIDVMNNSNVTRIYINKFHQYSSENEINLPTFFSPSNGSAISTIDHVWYNLNAPTSSYVVSPAICDPYAVRVIFMVTHVSHPKQFVFEMLPMLIQNALLKTLMLNFSSAPLRFRIKMNTQNVWLFSWKPLWKITFL